MIKAIHAAWSIPLEALIGVEKRVFELAEKAGRSPSRVMKLSAQDEATRATIQSLVRRRDHDLEH